MWMGPTLMMSPPTLHFYKYPPTLLPSSLLSSLLLHLLIHFFSRIHPLALGLEPLGVGFPRCSPNHHLGMLFSFFYSDWCIAVTVWSILVCIPMHVCIFLVFFLYSLFEYEDFGYLWSSWRCVVISVHFMHARCLSLCICVLENAYLGLWMSVWGDSNFFGFFFYRSTILL